MSILRPKFYNLFSFLIQKMEDEVMNEKTKIDLKN